MQAFFNNLRNIFLYGGCSRHEYRLVKEDARGVNYIVWKFLHIVMVLAYACTTINCFISNDSTPSMLIHTFMLEYSILAGTFFLFVFKKGSRFTQVIIYASVSLILLSTVLTQYFDSGSALIFFVIFIVILPMFIVGKPSVTSFVLIGAALVYFYLRLMADEYFADENDDMIVILCVLFGIFVNSFYSFLRIREFRMQRQKKDMIVEQLKTNEETQKLNGALKRMSESAVDLLGDVVESRDLESGEHIRRVKGFTYILANKVMEDLPEYGLDKYTVDLITFTSALHDVGKIAISDSILLKPGKLTDEEFEVMKTHCQRGCDVILKMKDRWSPEYIDMGLAICLNHHEKWDGGGYPNGIQGDEIPIAAQIVSIADIYDALTTKRVYKDAISHDLAFEMILSGECGAFSNKLLGCFVKCRERFEAHARDPQELMLNDREYEIVSRSRPNESFVIGLHDQDRTLREKIILREQVSVLKSLSEELYYICYVDTEHNEVIRYNSDPGFTRIIQTYGDMPSNEKFDKLLNQIIVSEDYEGFRKATDRDTALKELSRTGHLTTDFRIRLEDGIHHCRMKITTDRNKPGDVIVGIFKRDEEHEKEKQYLVMQKELETARREIENREKLADRLAVIDCISSEYDYVCTLNADTMDVVVYRAEAWIRDMFKNLEDIVKLPEARDATLRGIVHPDDFNSFQLGSRHDSVLRGLKENGGSYCVDYRAYKYGKLVNYQTRYAVDRNNPKRIVIGLHEIPTDTKGA